MEKKLPIAALAAAILTAPILITGSSPLSASEIATGQTGPSAPHAPFDKGLAAYQRGQYTAAFDVWLVLGKRGHAIAQYNLGQMYRKGQGVKENAAKAAEWYRLAAIGNHPWAQYNLGAMYVRGLGVPRDNIEGYKWLSLAAARGDKDAARARVQLAKRMPGADIAAAKKMVRKAKSTQTEAKTAKVTKTAATDDLTGNFMVQFGSMKNRPNAEKGVAELMKEHSEALGPLKLAVIPADLGEQGRFYRLRAQPLKGRANAEAACAKFKQRAIHCFVTSR
jgi:cell division septation protein DedD